MKNLIMYNYDIEISKINYDEQKKLGIILSKEDVYILKIINNKENFDKVIKYITNYFYKIILTKNNDIYFNYNDDLYVLFKVDNNSDNIINSIKPIVINTSKIINNSRIWENNIEYYIKTARDEKELDYISYYYIGMAENALAIYNRLFDINQSMRASLSHFRIYSPNYELLYKDPTNLTIDYISRDIAEYIKFKFFESNINIDEVMYLIKINNLNDSEIKYLIARLLYPNYFFETKDYEKIISKQEEYELFLKNILKQIKTTNLNLNIDWLS